MSGQQRGRKQEQAPENPSTFNDWLGLPPAYESKNPADCAEEPSNAIDQDRQAAAGTAQSLEAGKVERNAMLGDDVLSDIDTLAAKLALPETSRKQLILDVRIAVALAVSGKTSSSLALTKCENRYHETHIAYEIAPTHESAKALTAAYQNLRFRQKELGLQPQPRDEVVSLAQSQSRPSQAKAAPSPPGKPRRGRPSLTATLG